MKEDKEQKLDGGNVSDVYLVDNTIRRSMKKDSEKIHKLLLHLEKKGFKYAPRFLGIDDKNREILSYIKGVAGNDPQKDYMWSDEALEKIARMLKDYHNAVSDFDTKDFDYLDKTPPINEVLCHNDFALYNIIFDNELPVGVIDFDVVALGPRIWDIAYTLYTCIPLSRSYINESNKKVYYCTELHAKLRSDRIKKFFNAYGKDIPDDLYKVIILRLQGLISTIIRKANDGDLAFQKMVKEKHVEYYEKEIEFILKYNKEWNI